MSNIAKRPTRTPRRVREKRANQLVLVGGAAALVAVVGFVLALVTGFSWGIPFLAALIAVGCYLLFQRAIKP